MQTPLSVLVVDDDADVLKAARLALSREVQVETVLSPSGLAELVRSTPYDAVLLDMNFALGERSGKEGFDALGSVRSADPALSVVLMTTYGGVQLAVEALKRGAADFVLKPWRNEALLATVLAAAGRTAVERKAGAVQSLDQLEADAIRKALEKSGGNVSEAAEMLGLTRQALYRRMARHGL
jgi:two-component system, response regulator RegA